VSNRFRDTFVEHGMTLSGLSPDGSLVEIVELTNHPWFVGCQFHPELQSRPTRPHPLFTGFVAAAARRIALSDGASGEAHGSGSNGTARSARTSASEAGAESPYADSAR
jgi:CTP synthase